MLLVKTKLGQSKIHGLGLFADEFIAKGTLVQKFVSGIDLEIDPEIVNVLSEAAREQVLHYAYKHLKSGKYILCADDARFLNHSETPNLKSTSTDDEIDTAAEDIQPGIELTVNYKDFDAEWKEKLNLL